LSLLPTQKRRSYKVSILCAPTNVILAIWTTWHTNTAFLFQILSICQTWKAW
jgi:hypothetical protein